MCFMGDAVQAAAMVLCHTAGIYDSCMVGDAPCDGCMALAEAVVDEVGEIILEDLIEKVDDLRTEAYINYRSAVPGDVEQVRVAGAQMQAYQQVLKLIHRTKQGFGKVENVSG
jgi:hypothetical protein